MKRAPIILSLLIATILTLSACVHMPKTSPVALRGSITKIIGDKGSWRELLPLYKQLTEIDPPNSELRSMAIRYLLDIDLKLIDEKRAEEGLELALELNTLIPSDFYIQNRIIGAYVIMAEDAMAKKDYKAAEEFLAKKALSIRFDIEAMRTYLNLKMLQAKELYAQSKKEEATALLNDALYITNIDENKTIYVKEREAIEKLLKSLK